ncbi:MAG TPA: DAK2 domain-containing protein [Clostridiales bacterium]|nr:DAK2 domain-containing protein [Clostridiales bacterium]
MPDITYVDAVMMREMVIAGAALLEKNRDAVNALNVFPVPDGDTGTNMSMTMISAVREMNGKELTTTSQAAAALAKGALRGARGNSGVILSQLFRGFAKSLDGVDKATPIQIADAFKVSADTAYKAVMKPKEGTILTVARVIAEHAVKQAQQQPNDVLALFRVVLTSGESILKQTQEMLPVLKQAGVVDAGGRGLLLLLTGADAVLRGEQIEDAQVDMSGDFHTEAEIVDDHDALDEIHFAYCTEFLVQNLLPEVREADIVSFRRKLNRIGDCVMVVGDQTLLKVHVHTNEPGKALQYAAMLGEMDEIKIDNMLQQKREKDALGTPAAPLKDFGMVSVSLGQGFSAIFKDLGVDSVVDGGQTMNPSIEDLQKAVDSVPADTVFVLPNNGNITLAARQVAELSEKRVIVIPTKNVAMGIAAVVAFQPDFPAEDNEQRMNEAAQRVRTGTVTYAVRDSEYQDMHIKAGSIIGLTNGEVTCSGDSTDAISMELLRGLVTEDDGLITVYYGEDTQREDAENLAAKVAEEFCTCDVEVHSGGQPLYYYLLSVE